MTTDAKTLEDYLASLSPDRAEAVKKLTDITRRTLLPAGFEETVGYVGVNYVVPLKTFPQGYHCTPGEPLPFVTLASQARHVALYHMGIYGDPELLSWFQEAWAREGKGRLDMGKSCIRFSNPAKIPFGLLEDLLGRMDARRWVELYLSTRK